MKDLIVVTGLAVLAALTLYWIQRHLGTPPTHDTHTGLLKNSVYDCEGPGRSKQDCDEMKP